MKIDILLRLVNADKNHETALTDDESLVRTISYNCIILLVAPIGVHSGLKSNLKKY